MVKNTRIYNKIMFLKSWNNGSTRWLVTGSGSLSLFSKEDFKNQNELFDKLNEYITSINKYQVYAN